MKSLSSWPPLAVAFALGTVLLGWWTLPLLAAIWGFLRAPAVGTGWRAALAAVVAWTSLLLVAAFQGPLFDVAAKLGGLLGTPGIVPILVTLALPAALAGSAAGLAASLRKSIEPRQRMA